MADQNVVQTHEHCGLNRKHKIDYFTAGCLIGCLAGLVGGYYLGREIQVANDDILFGAIAESIHRGHYNVTSMIDKRVGVAYDLIGVPHGQGLQVLEAAKKLCNPTDI